MSPDHRHFAYADKLMDSGQASNNGMVFNNNMSGQIGSIGHNNMTPQLTVLTNMTVGHNQIIISNPGFTPTLFTTPVDGNILPDNIIISDEKAALLIFISHSLRHHAHCCSMKDLIIPAYFSPAVNNNMGANNCTFPNFHILTNKTIGPNLYITCNSGSRFNNSSRVYPGQVIYLPFLCCFHFLLLLYLSCMANINSASAASSSPT